MLALWCRVVESQPEEASTADAARRSQLDAERALQLDAYVRLREVVSACAGQDRSSSDGDSDDVEEYALRRAYNAFARDVAGVGSASSSASRCKRRAASVAFVATGLAELYADAERGCAYRAAFVYVRQLALKVRTALCAHHSANAVEPLAQRLAKQPLNPKDGPEAGSKTAPKGDPRAEVLCWRFVYAAKCWVSVVSRRDNIKPERLGQLVFPLCQVLFGAIQLAKSPQLAPLRLHCTAALHSLAAAAQVYVPTTQPLLATLDECAKAGSGQGSGSDKKGKKGGGSGKKDEDVSLAFVLSLGEDSKKREMRDALAKEACEQLCDYLELLRHSPALPELALVPMVALKAASKEKLVSRTLKQAALSALAAFEHAATDAEKRRAKLGCAPKDVAAFEALLPAGAPVARKRLAQRLRDRAQRKARLADLVPTSSKKADDLALKKKKGKKGPQDDAAAPDAQATPAPADAKPDKPAAKKQRKPRITEIAAAAAPSDGTTTDVLSALDIDDF